MEYGIRAECIRLATMGIACHWLRPKDKAPLGKGWAKCGWLSPLYLDRTYRAGYNFGIHTGRVANAALSLVGVDLDSVDALRWARHNLPESPLRTKTSKGEHWLYRAPEVAIGNRAKLRIDGQRIDIDVRGDGGNLVCAPSVHPSGFVYQQLGQWNEHGLSQLVTFDPSWFPATEPPPAAPAATPSSLSNRRAIERHSQQLPSSGGTAYGPWSARARSTSAATGRAPRSSPPRASS
jgi:hypothetical protein